MAWAFKGPWQNAYGVLLKNNCTSPSLQATHMATSSSSPALTLSMAESGLRAAEQHAHEMEAMYLIAQRQRESLLMQKVGLARTNEGLHAKLRSRRRSSGMEACRPRRNDAGAGSVAHGGLAERLRSFIDVPAP